ncbi:MAG: SDR family oxidoreductase [Thermoproteota archaeon]|nr:SDR family oxidoreductase [Thermoproteota archaeon]
MKNQNEKENMENNRKVAVVTGSSSGIGYATTLRLARSGYLTFATMRNIAKGMDLIKMAENENLPIKVEQLDVRDIDSIKDFMTRIGESTNRIDVLVNNAGYWLIGALEDLSIEEIQDQLDTNLLGTIRATQQVLPIMRAQKSGTIVNVTSALGRFGLPGTPAYVASKFALEGLTDSLAYEVEPFGIKVILVEPGVVKTKVKDNSVIGRGALKEDSPYSSMLESFNATFSALWENASTSDQVAAAILQAISSPEPKLRYPVGRDVLVWLEKKSQLTDEQFQEYMKNSMASLAPR